MDFSVESFYNPNLAVGVSRTDAIITVTASGAGISTNQEQANKAIVFVLDVSGSMANQKIAMGKEAICKCLEQLDKNTYVSVIAFDDSALVVVPMTMATPQAISRAIASVKQLSAGGSTCMSKALLTTLREVSTLRGVITSVQFVTDGDNNSDDGKELENALKQCEGKFQCDCWGIGTDWKPSEIRKISGRLLGTADAVPNPKMLVEHFKEALESALSKGVGNVRLRLQVPKSCKITTIKQMRPEIADLKGLTKAIDDKNIDIPIGSWGAESRDYHVAFEVEPQDEGDEMMVCRPKIVLIENGAERIITGQNIVAKWSSDEYLTTRINEQVAHYTGAEELARYTKEGLEAKGRGEVELATTLLGRALKISEDTGNDEVTTRLKKVVTMDKDAQGNDDPGTLRLRKGASKGDDLELDMGTYRTVRKRS